MTIFLVLALSLLIFFTCRKHNFILFYAPFSIVLQPWMCIRYAAPALSVSFTINFVLTVFLLLKRKRSIKNNPFYGVVVLMITGNLLGLFSSVNDIGSSFPSFVQSLCAFSPLLLLYSEIHTENDLKIVLRTFVWTAVFLLVYGFVEFVLQTNPLFMYVISQVPKEDLFGKVYFNENGAIRFGSIRCQSLMVISIAWGALCVIFFGVIVSIKNQIKTFIGRKTQYLVVVLSLIGIFTAGSRSPYVFLAIIILPLFLKKFTALEKIFCVVAVSVILVLGSSVVDEIIDSFSSKSDVSGSSIEMRVDQLKTILIAMNDNFVFGMGNKGLGYILKRYPNVYGAESVWFHTFISAGLCGVILLVLQYYFSFKVVIKRFQKKRRVEMSFFLLGWMLFSTITTSPGLSFVYFLTMLVIMIKCDEIYVLEHK